MLLDTSDVSSLLQAKDIWEGESETNDGLNLDELYMEVRTYYLSSN